MGDLVTEFIELLDADAMALGCLNELRAAQDIVAQGTSAERQRAVYAKALDDGADPTEALRAVVRSLMAEFTQGLD
jgi:carboxylate-amine ligase